MRDEISAAVVFLVRLIEKSENFNREQLEHFKSRLSELLLEKFENHWFPEKPDKGQGYRCIRVNGVNRRDETLEQAALACGIRYEDMKLPFELTIWVDPNEVCCRFGENKGSFCTLASFSDKESIGSSSGSEDSLSEDSLKESPSPLSTPVKQSNQVKELSRVIVKNMAPMNFTEWQNNQWSNRNKNKEKQPAASDAAWWSGAERKPIPATPPQCLVQPHFTTVAPPFSPSLYPSSLSP
ncbi:unnamed protein product [Nezara viridula]|uniref:Anti-proliferative protein domain-containing protein n=1 Tax=Nezara viridula TaxID=85310 RepID=A0A9P0H632_NEZVI|nr:unnamed protein product [Nezara viridula]